MGPPDSEAAAVRHGDPSASDRPSPLPARGSGDRHEEPWATAGHLPQRSAARRGFVWRRSLVGALERDDILRRRLAGGPTSILERTGRAWVGARLDRDGLFSFAVNGRRLFYLFGGFAVGAPGFPIGRVDPRARVRPSHSGSVSAGRRASVRRRVRRACLMPPQRGLTIGVAYFERAEAEIHRSSPRRTTRSAALCELGTPRRQPGCAPAGVRAPGRAGARDLAQPPAGDVVNEPPDLSVICHQRRHPEELNVVTDWPRGRRTA